MDGENKSLGFCPNGHALFEYNVYSSGSCIQCRREQGAASRKNIKKLKELKSDEPVSLDEIENSVNGLLLLVTAPLTRTKTYRFFPGIEPDSIRCHHSFRLVKLDEEKCVRCGTVRNV